MGDKAETEGLKMLKLFRLRRSPMLANVAEGAWQLHNGVNWQQKVASCEEGDDGRKQQL